MKTVDQEIDAAAGKFLDNAVNQKKPFFLWSNTTRMHVWTYLSKEYLGKTGIGLYPDGMVEHDDMVGGLLKKLDGLKITDNTIVIYSTDNGAETVSWPDAARRRSSARRGPRGKAASRSLARALAGRPATGHDGQRHHLAGNRLPPCSLRPACPT